MESSTVVNQQKRIAQSNRKQTGGLGTRERKYSVESAEENSTKQQRTNRGTGAKGEEVQKKPRTQNKVGSHVQEAAAAGHMAANAQGMSLH